MTVEPRHNSNVDRLKLLSSEPGAKAVSVTKRSPMLKYFFISMTSICPLSSPRPIPASWMGLPGGRRPPTGPSTGWGPAPWRPLGIPSGERPGSFLHDLRPSPSPSTPPPNPRWGEIRRQVNWWLWTLSTLLEGAWVEGNKGWPNQEMHRCISPNHTDLKTRQTGFKLANTQKNLLNATVMIHWDSLQFQNEKWQCNDWIYFPQSSHSKSAWVKDGIKAWKQRLKNGSVLIRCRKRRAEKSWKLGLRRWGARRVFSIWGNFLERRPRYVSTECFLMPVLFCFAIYNLPDCSVCLEFMMKSSLQKLSAFSLGQPASETPTSSLLFLLQHLTSIQLESGTCLAWRILCLVGADVN